MAQRMYPKSLSDILPSRTSIKGAAARDRTAAIPVRSGWLLMPPTALAGLGDLLATCSSTLSRNHTLGEGLARGRSLEEVKASMGSVVEGIATTDAALEVARELGVEMPITERLYRVLFDGFDPAQAMAELIGEV